jgi:uncharacterized protein with LGFP repeats
MYWSSSSGAHYLTGVFDSTFKGLGGVAGVLGHPVNESAVQLGVGTDGYAQSFQGGSIYSGPHGTFAVPRAIRDHYWAKSSTLGELGWPADAHECVSAGSYCSQAFEGGMVYSVPDGSFEMEGPIGTAYDALGGRSGPLGYPVVTEAAQGGGSNGDGLAQAFQNGSIYAGSDGAFSVSDPIRAKYWQLASTRGVLGWPTGEPECSIDGSCSQTFQHGAISVAKSGVGHTVTGVIGAAYSALGGASGALGSPTTAEVFQAGGANGDGRVQAFRNGSIYAGPDGAFSVSNPIRAIYWQLGSTRGQLGWPTAEPVCAGGECSQEFQHGVLNAP